MHDAQKMPSSGVILILSCIVELKVPHVYTSGGYLPVLNSPPLDPSRADAKENLNIAGSTSLKNRSVSLT